MYNFVCRLIILSQKFFTYCPWASRNNSISGATSLKALRKESLLTFLLEDELSNNYSLDSVATGN